MRINVAQQLKSSIGSLRNYEVNEAVAIADGSSMVQGEIELIRTDQGILVRGTLHTEIEVTCSRCLSLFSYPLTLTIEEEYFPVTDVMSGALLSVPEEPGYFTIDEHHVLDLTEAMRQCVLLAMPMKPLCRDDCAGLCPRCGCNLNQGSCDCLPHEVDARWSELSKLALAGDTMVNKKKRTE